VQAEVWGRCVEEALSEYAYDAEVAGVSYGLRIRSGALAIILGGFNDKLGVLLDAVTAKMVSMVEVPDNIYSIVADAYGDDLSNVAFHSQPYAQCSMRFSELTTRGFSFPSHKKYQAFQSLTREALNGMAQRLFSECHVEVLAIGNASPEDAHCLASALVRGLNIGRPMRLLPERKEALFPDGWTVWDLDSTDNEDPNHAVYMHIQMPRSLENDMLLRLLDKVLSSKFFDCLRTQQQLGYIVQLATNSNTAFSFLIAVVQTEFAPEYVRGRIDSFLEEHFDFVLDKLEEEEFQTCREGLLSEVQMTAKNLSMEMSRYARYFADRTYDFGVRQRAIDYLEKSVTLDKLRAFVKDVVRESPRLYVQVKKALAKEDKALPEGAEMPSDANITRWVGHAGPVEAFAASARWVQLNSSVEVVGTARL